MSDFPVIIPDDLIAWGKRPDIASHFPRPWADMIEALAQRAPLDRRDTRLLLNRLEALCAEAVRAGRHELLYGLDTRTAETLNVTCAITLPDGRKVGIGRGQRYSWAELRSILATDDPKSALAAVDRVKDLLSDVFPGVRVSDVSDTEAVEEIPCSSCRTTTSQVMMTTVHDTHYCGACWTRLTDETPLNYKRKNMTIRGRR